MSYGQIGAVVGNVVGSYFGGPVGGAIGSAIGGYAGASFDPTIVTTGPRLGDTKIQNGSYGTPIAISFGTVRAAGTVIFETKIREHLTREDTGKGGQATATDTYTYDFDFAVVLTDQHGRQVRGIKGIRRIWANGDLVLSAAENTTLSTLIASGDFCDEIKVYLGTDDQLPDPTIEAACGVGNVSAYRGYAYVVFRGAKVYQAGQPAPQMEFEIVQDGVEAVAKHLFASYAPKAPELVQPGVPWIGKDKLLIMNYEDSRAAQSATYPLHLHIFTPGIEDSEDSIRTFAGSYGGYPPIAVNCATAPYAATINYPSGNALDGALFILYDIERTGGLPVAMIPIAVLSMPEYAIAGDNRCAFEEATAHYAFGYTGGPAYYYGRIMFSSATGLCPLAPGRRMIDLAIYLGELYVWNFAPHPTIPSANQTYLNVYGANAELIFEWLHTVEGFQGGENQWAALCVNEHGAFTWSPGSPTRVARATAAGPIVLCSDANVPAPYLSAGHGTQRVSFWCNGDIANLASAAIGSTPGSVSTAWTIQFKALTKGTIQVGKAVEIIANIAGLDIATELDVSQLTDEMRGYSFKRVGPASGFIEPLATCFFFEGYESEGKIKFAKLGGPTARDIPFDDLAYATSEDLVEPFPLTRAQEKDLPRSLSLTYSNPGADYQTGAEPPARRVTTSSVNDVQLEMPIVFTSDEAAQRQFIILYKAWTERNTRQVFLSRKHADLEPTDVLNVEYPRGTWSRWRLKHVENQGQVIACDLVADEPDDLVSYAVAGNPQAETTTLSIPSPTIAEFLDVPIFSDAYDDPGFYVAMGGRNADWHGAQLQRSLNGTTFDLVDAVSKSATIGQCVTRLPDYTGVMPFDEHAVVQVKIRTFGTSLESFTENELLLDPGKNAAVIGDEIVQYRTATLVEANVWNLSGFVRGQRGTEWAMAGHEDEERFVLITRAGTLRVNFGAADLFVSRLYKTISLGARDGVPHAFTNTGEGLRPFAPVNLGFGQTAAGDGIFSFDRRTRLQINQAQAAPLPLGEAPEAYEIDIASEADFAAIVRTVYASSTPAPYSLALLTTDFGSGITKTFYWRVCQVSATVAHGHLSQTGTAIAIIPAPVLVPGGNTTGTPLASVPILQIWDGEQFIGWNDTSDAVSCSVYTSPDGLSYTETPLYDTAHPGADFPGPSASLASGNGLYVATYANNTYTSHDLVHWSKVQDGTGRVAGTPVWDGTRWVRLGMGVSDALETYVFTSPDAIIWTVGARVGARLTSYWTKRYDLHYLNGVWFFLDEATNSVRRSVDLATWPSLSTTTQPVSTDPLNTKYGLRDMAWNGSAYVVLGFKPLTPWSPGVLILSSADGITFTDVSPALTASKPLDFPATVVVFGTTFVAPRSRGNFISSADGSTWVEHQFPHNERLVVPLVVSSDALICGYGEPDPVPVTVGNLGGSFVGYISTGVLKTADLVTWEIVGGGTLTAT